MDGIDVGRALKAPFADPKWVNKTLLGWLWMFLVVTAPAVYGAQLDYVRSVSEGREELPDWTDFGGKWVRGFLLMIAVFIYMLPVWILGAVFALPGIIAAAASNGDSGAGLLGGGMCLFSLIAIVYTLAMAVLFYGATVNYAMKGTFGSLFAFGEIMGHIRDGSGYFGAWVWAIAISIGGSVVTSVLGATVIGYILVPAVMYLMVMIMSHVFGQWAARSYSVPQTANAYGPSGGGYIPPAPPTAPTYTPPAPPTAPTYTPPAPPTAPSYTPPAPPSAPAYTPPAPTYTPPAPTYTPPAPPAPPAAPAAPETPPAPPTEPPVPPMG